MKRARAALLWALAGAAVSGAGAVAQSEDPVQVCAAVKDDALRLACFDILAAAQKGGSPASTKTADVLKSAGPKEYKVVSGADLFVSPGKYEGKPIEVRKISCFHADKNEYRCLDLVNTVVVFAPKIEPDEARVAIEDLCGEIDKVGKSPKCIKNVRFVPQTHSEDTISGYRKRTIIITPSIEIMK